MRCCALRRDKRKREYFFWLIAFNLAFLSLRYFCKFFVEEFLTCSVVEYFSRTIIKIIDHDLYLIFRDFVKISSLRKKSSDHSVGVFVCSALPTFVRIGEKYFYSGSFRYFLMVSVFGSIVPSSGLNGVFWKCGKYLQGRKFGIFSRFFIYFLCKNKSCFTFYFCSEC